MDDRENLIIKGDEQGLLDDQRTEPRSVALTFSSTGRKGCELSAKNGVCKGRCPGN